MIANVSNFLTKRRQFRDNQAYRPITLLLVALFVLLFCACSSAPAEEPQVPDPSDAPEPTTAAIGPQILFSSQRDGNSEIFVMNGDGTDQRQLTDSDTIDFEAASDDVEWQREHLHATSPAWSPDNQQIAFRFVGEIFVMNADGTDIRQLTDEQGDNLNPVWSPDGQHIAIISNQDGDRDIWVLNVEGTDLQQLTDNRIADDAPAWSPDGQMIAYYSGFPLVLNLINADGGDPHPLIDGKEGYGWDPAWSPDSKQIAFVSSRDGDDEIFTVNVDGSDLRQITENEDKDGSPTWSADGLQLAFISDHDGDLEIYAMNVDGSDVRQLTDNDVLDEDPAWSSIP